MAKKEKEEIKTDGWKDTFSDLMNLLLCFFVLLYAMSNVDQVKYAELVASLSNSFSIFSGGEKAVGDGQLVSSGASQLNNLDDYYSDMGKKILCLNLKSSKKRNSRNLQSGCTAILLKRQKKTVCRIRFRSQWTTVINM